MKSRIVALCAALVAGLGPAAAQQAPPPLNSGAAKTFAEFQGFGPHRAFVVGSDGRANWYAGASGADPSGAVAAALKRCEDRQKQGCTLHVVNNYTVTGRPWRELVPARAPDAPDIGRLRPQPYWSMRGPQLAAGLIVWSHGYMAGRNATDSAPQSWIGRFTRLGYDLYRFDREWITDWASDATTLAEAVREARKMGYRRIVLAGQSAGAWVSLAALGRGAAADGVISIAAAHHGEVIKMRDTTRAHAEWQRVIEAVKSGPRIVLVNFAEDTYDVGGRMADARSILARSGVSATIIDDPDGFKGHAAGSGAAFGQRFGACIETFIETGKKQPPC